MKLVSFPFFMLVSRLFQVELAFVQSAHPAVELLNFFQVAFVVASGMENTANAASARFVVEVAEGDRHFGHLGDEVESFFPGGIQFAGTFGRDE